MGVPKRMVADPGGDGISLREAIAASNNTDGAETIEFDAALNGAVIDVLASNEGFILSGGELIINGDIDNDGNPDITLQGPSVEPGPEFNHVGLRICSSYNTIHGLNITKFAEHGISLRPLATEICTERILYGNKIVGNIVSDSPGHLITTEFTMLPPANGSDMGWEDTLIVENIVSGTAGMGIFFMAAGGGPSRNRIVNSIVANNHVYGPKTAIAIFPGDTASDWTQHPPEIRDQIPVVYSNDSIISHFFIVDNIIEDTIFNGISILSSDAGNQNNIVRDVKITGNTLRRIEASIIVSVSQGSGSRPTINNTISDVEISHNLIDDTVDGIQLSVGGSSIGPGDQTASGVLDDIGNNQLQDVLVKDNIISEYQHIGVFVWAGATNVDQTINVFNNTLQRLTIENNQLIAASTGIAGIQIMGGWSSGGPVSGNSITDLIISGNNIDEDDFEIDIVGGKGASATNNSIIIITENDNTGSLNINENLDGANGNTVTVP